ncbi:MAG TPA: nuclear transport factor 2 family protein [Solirubrobacterales bacterium]|jgi:ketosteroid isomerase-like protein
MGSGDMEVLRRMWEDFSGPIEAGHEERERFRELYWHPEITYEEDPRWPGSGTYRGKAAVAEVFEGYVDIFGAGEITVEDLVDAGDRLVALIRFRVVSAGGDVPLDHVWGYVCEARNGRLVYLRAYWDPEDALADAGVSSP